MRIRYSTRALADLEDILAFLHSRHSQAAAAIMAAIEDRIALLAAFPLLAPEADEPGTLVYTFHTVDDDPDVVVSYELFTDQDALAVHRDSPTVARVITELRAVTLPGSVQRLVPTIGKGLAQ